MKIFGGIGSVWSKMRQIASEFVDVWSNWFNLAEISSFWSRVDQNFVSIGKI